MKYINLRPFTVPIMENGVMSQKTYNMKAAITGLLFQTNLKLDVFDVIQRDDLAKAVDASGNILALADSEYKMIAKAARKFGMYTRNDAELLRRLFVNLEKEPKQNEPVVEVVPPAAK